MTYCVAMHLADGLVFASDSRTNAGIDHIATFRKLFTFGTPGERLLVVQTAGNLATSQSVINLLQQRIRRDGASLLNVPSVYDATALVAETTREVLARDGGNLAGNTDLSSFLPGRRADRRRTAGAVQHLSPGQLHPGHAGHAFPATGRKQVRQADPRPQPDFRHAAGAGPALRAGVVRLDHPQQPLGGHAAGPAGLPPRQPDPAGGLPGHRDDAYFSAIRRQWSAGLHDLLERLPSPPSAYNI